MGDKNVTIVVTFFSLLLFGLIFLYNFLYITHGVKDSIESIEEFPANDIFKNDVPLTRYIGGLYYTVSPFWKQPDSKKDEFQFNTRRHIRDIKQLISHARTMPIPEIVPEIPDITPEESDDTKSSEPSLSIRKAPTKKVMEKPTVDPFSITPAVNPQEDKTNSVESKQTIEEGIPKEELIHIAKREATDKEDEDDDDDNSTSTAAFMVVVILPALVIILIIGGLIVSHMWHDMLFPFNGDRSSLGDNSFDLTSTSNVSTRKGVYDIESGIGFMSPATSCGLLGACTKSGSELTSRRSKGKKKKGANHRRRPHKNSDRKKQSSKSVTFATDTNFGGMASKPVIRMKIDDLLSNRRPGRIRKVRMQRSILNDVLSEAYNSGTGT